MHPGDNRPSDQISMCTTLSNTKSENSDHPSSTNESSYASNQVQSIESSHGLSFKAPAIIMNEKKGKLYHQQDTQVPLNRNVKHAKMESQMAFCDPVTVQKQVRQFEQNEGNSEIKGVDCL